MKKNLLIALLVLIAFCSLIFAFYQTTEANKSQSQAIEVMKLALQNEAKAINEKKAADMARMEAERQKRIADDCLLSKRSK